MGNGEQTVAEDVRGVWLSAGAPILALILLVLVLAFALVFGFAQQQDRTFRETTHRLVASAIDARAGALADLSLDYTAWTEAHRAVNVRFDRPWLESNFYSSVADALIVFKPGETPVFSWVSEEYAGVAEELTRRAQRRASTVYRLHDLLRAETSRGTVARSVATLHGQLALMTIAPITPEDDAARQALEPSRTHYLITVAVYDAADISALGASLGLRNFSFQPASQAADRAALSFPVVAANGAVAGRLLWDDERPGSAALNGQFWLVAPSLLLAGLLAFFCARRLVRRQVKILVRAQSASESSRLKAGFIASMSHELRTPLNAIVGYAEMIEEDAEALGGDGASIRQDAARILVASRQLSRLVNDILDQSRLDAGRLPLKPETLDAAALVNEAAEAIAPAAAEKGARVVLDVAANAPRAYADHFRLHQCLVTLGEYALRSSRIGMVTIAASAHAEGEGRAFVRFDVSDGGPHMARPRLGKAATPLPYADAMGRDRGVELGLALVRKLARAMGGELAVASQAGKGSTLTLKIPAAAQNERVAA